MLDIITIYKYIIDPAVQHALLPIKILVFIISLVMFVAIIWFLMNTSYLGNRYLETWEDYRTWKRKYSFKAKKSSWQIKQNIADFKKIDNITQDKVVEKTIHQTVPRTDWERILDKLETGKSLNYNLALLDADKLLEKKLDGRELDEYHVQQVKQARELVEDVMADDSRDLTLDEVGEAINIYKKALESLD